MQVTARPKRPEKSPKNAITARATGGESASFTPSSGSKRNSGQGSRNMAAQFNFAIGACRDQVLICEYRQANVVGPPDWLHHGILFVSDGLTVMTITC